MSQSLKCLLKFCRGWQPHSYFVRGMSGGVDPVMNVFDRRTKRQQRNRTAKLPDYEVYEYIKEQVHFINEDHFVFSATLSINYVSPENIFFFECVCKHFNKIYICLMNIKLMLVSKIQSCVVKQCRKSVISRHMKCRVNSRLCSHLQPDARMYPLHKVMKKAVMFLCFFSFLYIQYLQIFSLYLT